MQKFIKFIKWFFAIAGLIPVLVIICFYIFKKDIERYGINAVNQEITVPFKVGSYDVTLWKTFPNFSFTLYELTIDESTPIYKKPLAEIKEARLVFNIWKVIKGKFEISKIKIDGITARIGIQGKNNNFDILKPSEEKNKSGSFNLENIKIYQSELFYWDKESAFKTNISLAEMSSNLNLTDQKNTFDIDLEGVCKSFIVKKDTFIKGKEIALSTTFYQNKDLTFKAIKLQLAQSKIKGNGIVKNFNTTPELNFDFSSENLTIAQLLPWIPSTSFNQEEYKSKGEINAKGSINGKLDKLNGIIDFELENGALTQTIYDVSLAHISTKGQITFGKNEKVDIPNLTAQIKEQPITLSLNLKDFSNPLIDFKFKGVLWLAEIGRLASIAQKMEGQADIDVEYKGLLNELGNSQNAPNWKGTGKIKLLAAGIKNNAEQQILSNLNGNITVGSNVLAFENINGLLTNSPFSFSGEIFPIASYLFTENKALNIHGSLTANHLNYEKINYIMMDNGAPKNQQTTYSIPHDLGLNLKVKVDTFTQNKFIGKNLTGHVLIANSLLKLEQIRLDFYEGNLSGNLTVAQQGNGDFIPRGYFSCNHVAIEKLFNAFDNFSQSEITAEQLSGLLTAEISIAGIWKNTLACDFNQFFAQMDLSIEKGRLRNYEPMKSLAKFVNVDELMDVQFEPLTQNLEIKNNWIYWSPMELKNNAINLQILSGKHSLDNEMDYHLKLNLNDILAAKYSLRKNRDLEQYTSTKDGGLNLFIHMYGNSDNLNFKYDAKNTAKTIVENAKIEKKVLNETLRKEFGLKPKDTAILKPKHIEVEWDE